VRSILADFPRRNSSIFAQMVQSLRRYYPDEFEFLKLVASGDRDFAREFADLDTSMVNHLVGYGVIDPSSMTIAIPVFGRWLRLHQP
jgi:hypothetical protein